MGSAGFLSDTSDVYVHLCRLDITGSINGHYLYNKVIVIQKVGQSHLSDLKMPKILVLWDIDGTLIEIGQGREDKHRRAVETVAACKVPEQERQGGKTDLQIISEIVSDNNLRSEVVPTALTMLDLLTAEELQLQPLPATENAKQTLCEVANRGWENGLLTGNTHVRAKLKLQSAGLLEKISSRFFFDGQAAQDRFQLGRDVAETLAQSGVNSVVVVGDTPLDIQASRFAGFSCVAVATGSFSSDELSFFEPDLLIQDLSIGFKKIMRFIETRIT